MKRICLTYPNIAEPHKNIQMYEIMIKFNCLWYFHNFQLYNHFSHYEDVCKERRDKLFNLIVY